MPAAPRRSHQSRKADTSDGKLAQAGPELVATSAAPTAPIAPGPGPSPLMSLPPRTPRMFVSIRFHHHPTHPPSPRSSLRRPSRYHAHLRILRGNLNLSLHPPPATRSVSSISNTMLPPLIFFQRPCPPRTVSVGALFLSSASSPYKSSRQSHCRLQLSHRISRIRNTT
jgi:hypothetical protein